MMGNTTFYDFTDAASKAFGNNMLLKGGIYAIFSGDVNQDGIIDSSDIVIAKDDASVFNNGYIVSDINGDGITDAGDLIVIDNNSSIFIGSIQP
jgi:hypothetical protein